MKTTQHNSSKYIYDSNRNIFRSRNDLTFYIGSPVCICTCCKSFIECSDWIKYPEYKCATCSKLEPNFKYLYRVLA